MVEFIKDEKNDRDTKILCFRKLVQAEGQEQVKSRIPEQILYELGHSDVMQIIAHE